MDYIVYDVWCFAFTLNILLSLKANNQTSLRM